MIIMMFGPLAGMMMFIVVICDRESEKATRVAMYVNSLYTYGRPLSMVSVVSSSKTIYYTQTDLCTNTGNGSTAPDVRE